MRKAILVALAVCFASSPVLAFHDQGVAHCNGCHTMHNSQDGMLVDPDNPDGNIWLLKEARPSDVCLNCHATGLGAVFAVDVMNPSPEKGGGNFIFLLEDNINDAHAGAEEPVNGDAAGHNLDAPAYGLASDGTLTESPGGEFPASLLGCTSCHDPHGNENFRLLHGIGDVHGGIYEFVNDAPVAEGLSLFFGSESNSNHTAYQSGMSAWCANCHGEFHLENGGNSLIHPSGSAIGDLSLTYNLYNGTSDQDGGSQGTAYLAAVPFEDPANTTDSIEGPSGTSKVSCITCHRAHATSAMDAGRWDFNVTGLAEDGHESGSYPIPNPYDVYQRSLCNKCHNKDAGDALIDFTPTETPAF